MPTAFDHTRLKTLREKAGLYHKDVAAQLGISRVQYTRMENGQTSLKDSYIGLLGDLYAVPPCAFYTTEPESRHA